MRCLQQRRSLTDWRCSEETRNTKESKIGLKCWTSDALRCYSQFRTAGSAVLSAWRPLQPKPQQRKHHHTKLQPRPEIQLQPSFEYRRKMLKAGNASKSWAAWWMMALVFGTAFCAVLKKLHQKTQIKDASETVFNIFMTTGRRCRNLDVFTADFS